MKFRDISPDKRYTPHKCQGSVSCKRNAKNSLTCYILDSAGLTERKAIIHYCDHHLAEELRRSTWREFIPPGFIVFCQWPNDTWQKRLYVYNYAVEE